MENLITIMNTHINYIFSKLFFPVCYVQENYGEFSHNQNRNNKIILLSNKNSPYYVKMVRHHFSIVPNCS